MFLKCHLWDNTHFNHFADAKDTSQHREGVILGTALLVNLATVASMIDNGNNPPAVKLTFKREEAREPLSVYGSVKVLARMLEMAGADGLHPVAHLAYATFADDE